LSLDDVELNLIENMDDVFRFKEWLGRRRPEFWNGMPAIGFDTETTGLSIEKDHVRLCQIGDTHVGWAFAWDRWSGIFQEVAETWEGILLAHNAKFDVGHLDKMGVRLPRARVFDTRVMAHILHPTFSTALKPLAARYVDPSAGAAQKDLDDAVKRLGWAGVPINFPPYWQYGALDPVLTARLGDALFPQVMADAPDAFFLENEVSWSIEKMERYGAHIDVPYALEHYEKFGAYCAQVEQWCLKKYGIKPGQNAEVVRILQEAGHTFSKATASGAVALDKEVLDGIEHELAQAVLNRRQVQKLQSTYLKHYITEIDEDGLIHPSINVLGARTSRMSMQNPNLQNLPRKSEKNKAATIIRNCIDTRYHSAGSMLFADFDQVEMRMLAALSNDHKMMDAFRAEGDFFVNMARELFQDMSIEKSDPRRQLTKNTGYATIYGAGGAKLALTAGVSESQAKAAQLAMAAAYPTQYRWRTEIVNTAMQRAISDGEGWVRCPITGRRHVADPRKEYALVNFMIQGGAAAVLKKKIIELDAAGLGDYMVAPVHDEIILDVPDDRREDAIATLRDIMNDTTMFPLPITAGISEGKRWGDKIELDPHHISSDLPYNLRGGKR
jgi:DNA polymerase I-like protein with 3'-5' exonuclease and polymerase domains